uniref:Wsv456 n=1 Tax=White spot syndrome virus TaxID=92652 RepID=A0A2U9GCA0_WSSV|nr:wsv456 [Shrimp white spot syndrome virus]AWQ62685.1 wsv456 [Shrimp white spot syndrome virus]
MAILTKFFVDVEYCTLDGNVPDSESETLSHNPPTPPEFVELIVVSLLMAPENQLFFFMYTKKFTPTNINGANIINMIIKRKHPF